MILLGHPVLTHLIRQRRKLDAELTRLGIGHTFSLPRRRLQRRLFEAIERHAHGRCLDAGSGRSPYRHLLGARGCRVISVDIEDRAGKVDIIADLQAMPHIADGSMATVLCSQVLEHLPRPWEAMEEMARVLRPGGVLILSVPHLAHIHEAPNDYFRFTRYGIKALCERVGLEVVSIDATGGMVALLAHGASMVLMSTLGSLPLLRWPVWLINYVFLVQLLGVVDHLVGLPSVYPCDYVAAARKPASSEAGGGSGSRHGR